MKKAFIILLLIIVSIIPAKTRWGTTRFTPNADMIGAGRFIANYNIFLNTEYDKGVTGKSLLSLDVGASEWFEVTLGYADGVNFALKGRILDEYTQAVPSLAIGIRNMFHNSTLARSRLNTDQYETTGELFAAFSKSFNLIQTRFNAGVLSLPGNDKNKINGFVSIEKNFGNDFYLTAEGFSQQKKFYTSLTATVRFLKENNGEIYFSILDFERMFITQKRDFGVSFTPQSQKDWVKPGVVVGLSFSFGGRQKWINDQAQFRTVEDNFANHDTLIKKITLQIGELKNETQYLDTENSFVKSQIDSLKTALGLVDTLPIHYSEIYSRIVSYNAAYSADVFDPLEIRRIIEEVKSYGKDGIDIVAKIAKESSDRAIKMRSVTMLGDLYAWDKVPVLLEILQNTIDSRLKVEIIAVFGKINDRSVKAKIEEFANSADDNLRIAANEVLDLWNKSKPVSKENVPLDTSGDVFSPDLKK
ncbi:MAG: HEAT repeat domain-containing protein [Chitinispirillales bacterium]|jgi:hypothetical protein|nr:HEAT repeat domain-containing protein [Chitinispirillales bacterium]